MSSLVPGILASDHAVLRSRLYENYVLWNKYNRARHDYASAKKLSR